MTNKENNDDRDKQEGNSHFSSPVISVPVPWGGSLHPFGPLPDFCVDGPIEADQEQHGHDVQEQSHQGCYLQIMRFKELSYLFSVSLLPTIFVCLKKSMLISILCILIQPQRAGYR